VKRVIKFNLNGEDVEAYVQDNVTILDFLRKEMKLTGTKRGCEEGECGACTILLDGKPITACMMFAVEAEGHKIVTIEGVMQGGKLHPVQKEFIDKWALQCGFCTPGVIISAIALLEQNSSPTEHEIRDAIAGNLCRCTGYAKIVEAIASSAEAIRKGA
jgi:carbon-monoxide dehydrogenase small subunit